MAIVPRIIPNPAPLQATVYLPSGLWNALVSLTQPFRVEIIKVPVSENRKYRIIFLPFPIGAAAEAV
jgi:hypothetical protein